MGAEKGKDGVQMLYLSAGSEGADGELCPASARAERLHLLILADLKPLTIKRAEDICRTAVVDKILLPENKNRTALPDVLQKAELCEVDGRYEECFAGFTVKVFAAGPEEARVLLLYFGSRGVQPQTEECMMNVKRCLPELPCHLTVDAANLNCEMRCLLCRDYTQCRKHNRGDETYFVDGHLLLAASEGSDALPELKEYLAEEWKHIRFIGLPRNIDDAQPGELSGIGTPGHQRYYIGCADTAAAVVKAVECEEPSGTFISVSAKAGLCVSGCYAKR
ncbi:hypothetical protein BRYFOR_08311 [Marvinbryantia formatexigens DSM 14469]|uniref:Uncharacterized protein n=2 Tax=Marvinbryantia TaxID=248744 RepID=C6LI40_9FIRM|nr:hypothetical protein BRYFOR_08311 [Marvinbryantia formatexigens DSM 14469]